MKEKVVSKHKLMSAMRDPYNTTFMEGMKKQFAQVKTFDRYLFTTLPLVGKCCGQQIRASNSQRGAETQPNVI